MNIKDVSEELRGWKNTDIENKKAKAALKSAKAAIKNAKATERTAEELNLLNRVLLATDKTNKLIIGLTFVSAGAAVIAISTHPGIIAFGKDFPDLIFFIGLAFGFIGLYKTLKNMREYD